MNIFIMAVNARRQSYIRINSKPDNLSVNAAEIIGDGVAEVRPILRHNRAQEGHDRVDEVAKFGIT